MWSLYSRGWCVIYRPETVGNESRVTKLMVLNGIFSESINSIPFFKTITKVRNSKLLGESFSKMFLMGLWYQGQYFVHKLQYFLKKVRIFIQKMVVYNPPSFTYFLEIMQMKVEKDPQIRKREFISSLEKYYEDYYRTLKQG